MNVFSLTILCIVFSQLSPLFRGKRVLRSTVWFETGFLFLARSLMSSALNMEDKDIIVFNKVGLTFHAGSNIAFISCKKTDHLFVQILFCVFFVVKILKWRKSVKEVIYKKKRGAQPSFERVNYRLS